MDEKRSRTDEKAKQQRETKRENYHSSTTSVLVL